MARRSKFTQETKEGLLTALRHGASYVGACASVGISFETFRLWREKGEKSANGTGRKSKEFEQFYYDVLKAEQASYTTARKVVLKAAIEGDWKAAEAYLKGRDPEWGKDSNVNVKVKSEQKLDDDQFDKAISELTNAIGEILPKKS